MIFTQIRILNVIRRSSSKRGKTDRVCSSSLYNQGGSRGGFRQRINEVAQKFRMMGATSPATAKTAEELGLPPRFQQAMRRRLGQTGIFVEVNGKYYLDESRLAQLNQQGFGWRGQRAGGGQGVREKMFALRIARIILSIAVLVLLFGNLFYFHSFDVWIAIGGLIIVGIVISIMQLIYASRARSMRRMANFP